MRRSRCVSVAGMNGDSADESSSDPWSSSGLNRSYSEHAALVLRHFERCRDEPKSSRSGPEFRFNCHYAAEAEETATEDNCPGQRTWRISGSASEDDCRENLLKFRGGDSNALIADFSELSLDRRETEESSSVYEGQRLSQTNSEMERQYRLFSKCASSIDGEGDRMHYQRESQDRGLNTNNRMHEVEASDSSSRHRLNGVHRQISYENWVHEKRKMLLDRRKEEHRSEERKRELEEREAREREARERRYNKFHLDWLQRNRREQLLKRQLLEKELELQRRLHEIEDKAKSAKDILLKQWCRKKNDQRKASEKERFERQKKLEEIKVRRLEESSNAYEKWRAKAKNAPRPATQGLLPHQKAKPSFTNPVPWQPLLENPSDDSDSSNLTTNLSTARRNQRSKRTSSSRR